MTKVIWNVLIPLLIGDFKFENQARISDIILKRKTFTRMEQISKIRGHLIIANHIHALDPILVREKVDGWVISKTNLANGNLFYKIFEKRVEKVYHSIPYERGCLKSGEIVKQKIVDKINEGKNVIIFPEGNCKYNNADGLLPIKKGIIHLSYDHKIPLVILTIWYNNMEFGQGGNHVFSLRRTCSMDVSGELYFEEIVNPADFEDFDQYYNYISENMNWYSITKSRN